MKLQAKSNAKRLLELNFGRIAEYVKQWAPDTIFDVEVIRRLNENKGPLRRYYWSTVLPCYLEAYCYDPEDAFWCHRDLKILFFHVQPDRHGNYPERDIPKLFSDDSEQPNRVKLKFIEWVCRLSAAEGIRTPEPGERWKAA